MTRALDEDSQTLINNNREKAKEKIDISIIKVIEIEKILMDVASLVNPSTNGLTSRLLNEDKDSQTVNKLREIRTALKEVRLILENNQ